MKQQGIVVDKKDGNIIEIEIIPHHTCHKCGSCSAKEIKRITFCGDTSENIQIGEKVEIRAESGYLLFSYFVFYIVPLLFFFPALFIAFQLTASPIISFAGGISGMFLAYIIIAILFRKHQKFYQHLIIRKI